MHKQTGKTPDNFKDLSDMVFGRLTVIERASNIGDRRTTWLCKCICGNEKVIESCSLHSGKTKSCGRLLSERMKETKFKHGFDGDRLWSIWKSMIKRCYNKSHKAYDRYGGRGISICCEWKDNFLSFRDWSLNNGYAENLTIDRKDNDGNYEPNNCRWTIDEVQNYNKSNTIHITINSFTKNISEWSTISGIPKKLIYDRFKRGWKGIDLLKPKQ